ncbi:MAG: PCRF domain-containing protein, partial [Anaerovoracaceae bacterium]
MYDKLKFLEEKYHSLSEQAADPQLIANQSAWQKCMKEISDLEPIVQKYREYKKVADEHKDMKDILEDSSSDQELREMVKMELPDLAIQLENLTEELKVLLLPKDPNDD